MTDSEDAALDRIFQADAVVAVAEPAVEAKPVAAPVAKVEAAPVTAAPVVETPVFDADREASMLALRRYGVDPTLYGTNTAAMVAAGAKLRGIQTEFDRTKSELGELRKQPAPQTVGEPQGVLTPDVDLAAKEFAKQLGSEEFEGPLKQFGGTIARAHAHEVATLKAALQESTSLLGEVMSTAVLDAMTKDFPGLSDGGKRSQVREKAMALVKGGGYQNVSASKMEQMRAALTDSAVLLLGRTQADAARDAGQPTVPGPAKTPVESFTEDQLVDAIAESASTGKRDEVARYGALLAEKRRRR